MAGLISGKLRGVCAKFWARLQIFFKSGGLRVESTKVQGLFNKMTRRRGTVDLIRWIEIRRLRTDMAAI